MSIRPSRAALTLALATVMAVGAGLVLSPKAHAQSSALYTDAQAQQGVDPYESKCAMCHGANMEGAQAPTLLGPTFTSHYLTVGALMQFIVKNMPMDSPGSLPHEDYVDILAYILLKNGWSSGARALTFEAAGASKASLSQMQ